MPETTQPDEGIRDEQWLKSRLDLMWDMYYSDCPKGYPIEIIFGNRALRRLGSIHASGKKSIIRMNRLFALPSVPAYVVDATICHELAHYAHGFGSGLPRRYKYPHVGGVVELEMQKRGCLHLDTASEAWRKENWERLHETEAPDLAVRREVVTVVKDAIWKQWMEREPRRSVEDLVQMRNALARRIGISGAEFGIEWRFASEKQSALSHRFRSDGHVELHGCLADKSVPEYVLQFEIAYWLIAACRIKQWERIQQILKNAGLWEDAEKALQWRDKHWLRFLRKNHPLHLRR